MTNHVPRVERHADIVRAEPPRRIIRLAACRPAWSADDGTRRTAAA